jgi:predicted TIM-barrel fold metal-dependent hydrolase
MVSLFNRREFVATSCLSTALPVATSLGNPLFAESKPPQLIDAHVHVWTPDTQRYPLAEGYKKSDIMPVSFTPEQLFAHCRPTGVTRIVLIQMSFYRFDNSYMLDMMKKFRGVFGGVGIVDENNQPVRNMLKQSRQGVRGFRIQPKGRPANKWLNGDGMKAMWQAGAKHNLAMCPLINVEHLPSVGAMCQQYPDTPVVIDHFGRVGIDGEIRKADLDQLCALAKHRNVSVKISAYYALGKKQAPYKDLLPMIKRCLDAFGPERLMWASDGPFQVVKGHEYAPSIDLIKQADFLSASDKDLLLRGTAERVFF